MILISVSPPICVAPLPKAILPFVPQASEVYEEMAEEAGIPKEEINSRIIYQSPLDLRHYLTQEIERLGNVNPQAAHNWKFTPEEWTIPAAKRDYKQLFGEEKQ